MAKRATSSGKSRAKPKSAKAKTAKGKSKIASTAKSNAGDAFIHLLQSPLVAELVALAATAAIATFAASGTGKKGAGKAVKAAGLAAASAIGQRLTSEVSAIRKSVKSKA